MATRPFQLRPPAWSLTLIAKGTYRLSPGSIATAVETPDLPLGDLHTDDDPRKACSYPSDFALFKPRADLLLTGKAHAPRGRPVTTLPVSFAVGKTALALGVTGDRYWTDPGLSLSSAPQPFVEMPLGFERAFGGPRFAPNPAGKGLFDPGERDPLKRPLPNIEDPRARITSPTGRPAPAGFGPLGATWALRAGKLGTYDERWLQKRWPFFPEDFDHGHFNAAVPALQTDYLRGDEEIVCHNLHREHPEYRAKLPGLRVRCFVDEQARFREVTMRLDTLWIDMETEKLVLVWRGVADVSAETHPEIKRVYLASERLDEAPLPVEHHRERLALELAAKEPPEVAPAPEAPANDNSPSAAQDDEDEQAELMAQIQEQLAKAGAPAALIASLGTPEGDVQLEAWLGKLGGDPAKLDEMQKKNRESLRRALESQGEDPALADTFDAAHEDEPADEDPRKLPWSRARVEVCLSIKESMAEADLSGLDLSNLDLSEACLSRAKLLEANLEGARLACTDLEGATLARATFKGAWLPGAKLAGVDLGSADLTGADLTGAVLTRATLDGAVLRGAILTGADAAGASFVEADLTDARLDGAKLGGARLARATVDRASFRGASLVDTSLEGAHGEGVDLRGADLSGLRAAESRLPGVAARGGMAEGAHFDQADLRGADLALARMKAADLNRALLEGADLRGADLAGADLTHARLQGARAKGANLTAARLEAADLRDVDLRGASLYEAAMWRARLEGADLGGAHLAATLLTSPRGAT